jgi:hypothetical protein
MSNRFYEVGLDVEHLLNVISEILGAHVVILLHSPSSIRMSFVQWSWSDHHYPWCNYLDTEINKRAIRPLNLERLQKERQQSTRRATTLEEQQSTGRPSTPDLSPHCCHRRFHPKPIQNLSVWFVLATVSHPMLLRMLCGKWNARVDQKVYIWL